MPSLGLRDCGRASAAGPRLSLRPLISPGRDNSSNGSGASRREIADLCLMKRDRATLSAVIARECGPIQYSEAPAMEPKGRGVLDTPHAHARGMTMVAR
jgi:hypothetical protein